MVQIAFLPILQVIFCAEARRRVCYTQSGGTIVLARTANSRRENVNEKNAAKGSKREEVEGTLGVHSG